MNVATDARHMASSDPLRSSTTSGRAGDRRIAVGVVAFVFGVYALFAGGHTYSSDEEGLFFTTKALVERRSPVVDATDDNIRVLPVRAGRTGGPVTVGGFAQSVVATPLYLAGSIAGTGIHGGNYGDYPERLFVGWLNSLVTAIGAGILYLFARRLGATARWAVALALTYAFGTYAFPHAKTFFSEPLAATLSLGAAYLVVVGAREHRFRTLVLAGLVFGFALHARTSVGLFALGIGTYLVWMFGREGQPAQRLRRILSAGVSFGAGMALPLALLMLTNWWRFGGPLDMGYQSIPLDHPIEEGLYGLFLSPGKSIFLYAPPVAVGIAALFTNTRWRAEVSMCAGFGFLNALFFARFVHWHGDHSWGPRYLILSLPFWLVPIAPTLGRLRWRRALIATGALGLASASLGVVMYFNQYFNIADQAIEWTFADDGPTYWRSLHFDPYWSPILGHARALPDVVDNTVRRVDGEDPALKKFPGTTVEKYSWYFGPPQFDSWVYWLRPAHGPHRFLLIVPVFVAAIALGGRTLVRATRE